MKGRNKKRREKCYVLIFKKRHMKKEKDIAPMDFAEYLRKSEVSERRKVYWNERYCYISKSRWDVQYLEKSVSYWLLVERWGWNWMIKSFWWSLYYALLYYNIINVILPSLCSTCCKWMHFEHVLSSWKLQQITDMLYVRDIAKRFLSTLLLMFISSWYFI